MLNLIMVLFLTFDGSSVSTSRRSEALFMNPAGLGMNMGVEAMYLFANDEHSFSTLIGNSGFGVKFKGNDYPVLMTGTGINLVNILYLGYGSEYQFGKRSIYTVGGIFRPSRFISTGAFMPVKSNPDVKFGIAVRPFTDRVTLFYDAIYSYEQDSIKNYFYGIGVELINGISFAVKTDKDKVINVGAEISFGNFKIGGFKDKETNPREVSLIASNETYRSIPIKSNKKRTAELDIKGAYPELKMETNFFGITLGKQEPVFYNLLRKLEKVKTNKNITTIVIKFENYSLGMAQLEELYNELKELKAKGKKIITFANQYGLGSYYLASLSDYIILQPLGYVEIPGLSVKSVYLKGTMEKLGVEADIARVGKYKSATEALERKNMSDESREQIGALLDDIWNPMVAEIAGNRDLPLDSLQKLVNTEAFFNSDDAVKNGLVDTVVYEDELEDVIKKLINKTTKVEKLDKMLKERKVPTEWQPDKSSPKIAVLIAEGDIITGESSNDWLFGTKTIGSKSLVKAFKDIEKDKSIKSVVFRINSGGGDGFASEVILRALKKTMAKKPVIVSMGDVAGSGGYYIGCQANKIMADNYTLTGSIGVFGANIIWNGLYEKLGITHDVVKRGEHSDAYAGLRHFTDEEQNKFQREIEWFYDKFISRVAEGRKMSKSAVDSLGQGRIWSGASAKKIRLVDENCGLLKAIEIAKKEAGLTKEPEIVIFPVKKGIF
ncbi:MAG: signal peptide peptidase SppA [bacterium]|nr:signal peptide peptidase SppA [bacterium]